MGASLQNHTSIGARGARFGTFGLRKALSALAGYRFWWEVTGCSRRSYVKAGDRIRTGDVQLGKLAFYP